MSVTENISREVAPVILFIYNRPGHTQRTLEALSTNVLAEKTLLYVFADGPKEGATAAELESIERARAVACEKKWCKEVNLVARERNLNLEDNVIDGVTSVINKHGRAIVLEDDLVTSPYFLKYCNDGLDAYENMKQVFSINGFMFPIDFGPEPATFLSPVATSSWGWATWADRWQQFEMRPEYTAEIASNRILRNRFNVGCQNYLYMLENMNTWDIRWYYTAFIRNGLGLFPTRSLVQNIGFDGSGAHGEGGNLNLVQSLYASAIGVNVQHGIDIPKYAKVLAYFDRDADRDAVGRRIKNRLKRLLHL